MNAPDSFAVGHRPRRFCVPTIIRINSVETRPKTLAMLQRCPQIHSVSTVVPKVNGYSGSYTPNWAYYYHNSSPPYRNSYYDLCNVYWHHKYPACPSDWHSWVPA